MSEHEHVAAIKYSADQIDTEVKLASDLETIQIVCMNTSMIRADTDALAAKLAEAEARVKRWQKYARMHERNLRTVLLDDDTVTDDADFNQTFADIIGTMRRIAGVGRDLTDTEST